MVYDAYWRNSVPMMYVWVRAIKIRHHYISTKPLNEYYQIISDIKADESIPKYASNLVYVNHADKEGAVDDKLLYSIINKQPKRADHYWLINLEFADTRHAGVQLRDSGSRHPLQCNHAHRFPH